MNKIPKNRSLITVLTSRNIVEDIYFEECSHCVEKIPVVGKCTTCGTDYQHLHTVENYETGFLHYVFTCSGCPENQSKAQKIIKVHENSSNNGEATRKAAELTRNFLN